jgi:hypothetical protein
MNHLLSTSWMWLNGMGSIKDRGFTWVSVTTNYTGINLIIKI